MIAIAKKGFEVSVRDRIVECLAQCQAKNVSSLSKLTGLSCGVIKKQLDCLVREKEVEVLRPLPLSRGIGKRMVTTEDSSAVHFRLIRDTDCDYLWEQGDAVRFPGSRVCVGFGGDSYTKMRQPNQNRISWLRKAASFGLVVPGLG